MMFRTKDIISIISGKVLGTEEDAIAVIQYVIGTSHLLDQQVLSAVVDASEHIFFLHPELFGLTPPDVDMLELDQWTANVEEMLGRELDLSPDPDSLWGSNKDMVGIIDEMERRSLKSD